MLCSPRSGSDTRHRFHAIHVGGRKAYNAVSLRPSQFGCCQSDGDFPSSRPCIPRGPHRGTGSPPGRVMCPYAQAPRRGALCACWSPRLAGAAGLHSLRTLALQTWGGARGAAAGQSRRGEHTAAAQKPHAHTPTSPCRHGEGVASVVHRACREGAGPPKMMPPGNHLCHRISRFKRFPRLGTVLARCPSPSHRPSLQVRSSLQRHDGSVAKPRCAAAATPPARARGSPRRSWGSSHLDGARPLLCTGRVAQAFAGSRARASPSATTRPLASARAMVSNTNRRPLDRFSATVTNNRSPTWQGRGLHPGEEWLTCRS